MTQTEHEASGDIPHRVELAPGYSISRVINGCWQLSSGHGGCQDASAQVLRRLAELADAGFTTFDCADIYTGVEALLGQFIRQRGGSEGIEVHTKFVPDLSALAGLDRDAVETAINRSLRRLGVERLDLVQFHWWDYSVPGCAETLEVLDALRRDGKIRHLGLTNFDAEHLATLFGTGIPLSSMQLQYSLIDRRPERGMAGLCRRNGIALLAYGALSGGLLTGRQLGQERMQGDNRSLKKYRLVVEEAGGWEAYQQLLDVLGRVASRHEVPVPLVAARWVLDRPGVAGVILGIGSRSRVAQNTRLFELRLTVGDRREIEAALSVLQIPPGDVFELERDPGGPHRRLMKTDLNAGSVY